MINYIKYIKVKMIKISVFVTLFIKNDYNNDFF